MILGKSARKRIGDKEQESLFALQKGKCMYCGKKMGLPYFHVDHNIPVSRGGTNKMSNLQLICSPCNTRKGRLTNGEFRRKYDLTPASEVKGPPIKAISQEYFQKKAKEIANKPKRRRRNSLLLL